MVSVAGVLLAAGAGRRMGLPKSLVRDRDGRAWLSRSVDVLSAGGCDRIVVVLGAGADEATSLLAEASTTPSRIDTVLAADWTEGMGASLRAGLRAIAETETEGAAEAVLVHLVDLPDVGADVIRRVLAGAPAGPGTLARASYDGSPGHPVLLGRDHWMPVAEAAQGDRGARDYLASRAVWLIECGDLATGRDIDRPDPER
ncbi:nucleotidyltransferase family protein [Nocardioides sp. BGMRC 2183]|nr:nucleotidyltransferase family protein [Nocardioides sp. BGMRC 2183]